MNEESKKKVKVSGYIALVFAIAFFSGVMGELSKLGGGKWAWLAAFDYTTLCGSFGKMGEIAAESGVMAANFRGMGGSGPKDAFLFAITLIPSIMFALGMVRVITNFGALDAAGKLLTPILRPILGVPGDAAIAMVSNFQSADVGASLVSSLKEENRINEKERLILTAFEYSSPGLIVNFFSIGAAVFAYLEVPLYVPILVIVACKFIGANLMRFALGRIIKLPEEEN